MTELARLVADIAAAHRRLGELVARRDALLIADYERGEKILDLAARYGVPRGTVHSILVQRGAILNRKNRGLKHPAISQPLSKENAPWLPQQN